MINVNRLACTAAPAAASAWVLMLACSLLAGAPESARASAQDPGRVTTRFAIAQVKPLLLQVSKLCTAGFTRDEAQRLAGEINALKTEQAGVWEFTATCKGLPRALRVRALVDELSEVDLDFATDPEFAAQIREAVAATERK